MAGPEFDSGSETQSSFSVGMWLVSPIVGTSSLLGGGGGRRRTGPGPWHMRLMRNNMNCLARAKAPPPPLARFKGFSTRGSEQRKTPADLRRSFSSQCSGWWRRLGKCFLGILRRPCQFN